MFMILQFDLYFLNNIFRVFKFPTFNFKTIHILIKERIIINIIDLIRC
jgi:hypothetical protein